MPQEPQINFIHTHANPYFKQTSVYQFLFVSYIRGGHILNFELLMSKIQKAAARFQYPKGFVNRYSIKG